jgi:hypothetical protein
MRPAGILPARNKCCAAEFAGQAVSRVAIKALINKILKLLKHENPFTDVTCDVIFFYTGCITR